jgi:ABC-type lipoprotein export system ATPase subunit
VSGPLVRCEAVSRTYGSGRTATVALREVTCTVEAGAQIALTGPSGSGKTTLLHLLAGLDEPTEGTIAWPALGARGSLRPGPLALVFQGPSLLPPLTVAENVALPLQLLGEPASAALVAARAALDRLDLLELADKLPEEISGGQSQRAAVARAIVGRPRLILADEPTGQLDHASGEAVVTALVEAAADAGAALLVSTHDPAVAERLAGRWELRDGRLVAVREAAFRA